MFHNKDTNRYKHKIHTQDHTVKHIYCRLVVVEISEFGTVTLKIKDGKSEFFCKSSVPQKCSSGIGE